MGRLFANLQFRLACGILAAAVPATWALGLTVAYATGVWAVTLLATAVVNGLCVGAAWLIAGVMCAPLGELSREAEEIASGNFEKRLRHDRSSDPLARIARAFNAIVAEVHRGCRTIEQRLAGRMRELQHHNARLEHACREAEQSRAFKDEFLANMSHEIRTPLTAIVGYAELLVDTPMPEGERVKALQNIQYNGQHLLSIINDVLDVARLDASKMEVEAGDVQPVQLINDVATLMRGKAQEKGLALDVEFATHLPELIHTDATRLRQIVLNLLGNAVKFTHAGSIRLVVKLIESGDRGDSFLQFEVIDTGIGMTPEQMSRLFRPFAQGEASRAREYGGSGLGLVISQRLARLLGGDITVHSVFGEGSTFTATVAVGATIGARMMNPSNLLHDSVAAYAFTEDEHAADLKDVRVLLADDTPANLELIGKMLRTAGASVDVVANGKLACHRAMEAFTSGRPFHVVLMDIQMPELDGYGATKNLRTLGYPGPIVALTASVTENDKRKCVDAGCNDVAAKPIERKKLIALVARWADDSGAPFRATSPSHAA